VSFVTNKPVALDLERDGWAAGPPPPPAPEPEIIPVPMPRRPDGGEAKRPRAAAQNDPRAGSPRSADVGADGAAMAQFAQRVARGAGLPEDTFAARDAGELAE
jgi:hypothetical protein